MGVSEAKAISPNPSIAGLRPRIDEANPNDSYGEEDTRSSDDDTLNSLFGDERGQALVRFDGLLGEGVGRVPLGSQILSAHLSIQIVDDVDFLFDVDFFVHQVLVPWEESSTWSTRAGSTMPSRPTTSPPVCARSPPTPDASDAL